MSKSKHYIYPMIFVPVPFGFSVYSPDLPSAITQGKTVEEAILMAKDVLSAILCEYEDDGLDIPSPVIPVTEPLDEGSFVAMIDADTLEYRKLHDDHAVKKTLTIPAWLDHLASRENINFSQTLQEALKSKLGV